MVSSFFLVQSGWLLNLGQNLESAFESSMFSQISPTSNSF